MAKTEPFFSIVIPTLNVEKYLSGLLSDLASQTYRDFEIIIVDGKSTDKTTTISKSFAKKVPKLSVLTSQKRHVCTQRNLGAFHARAPWIIFVDADSRIAPYFLEGIKYRIELTGAEIISPYFEPDVKSTQNEAIAAVINLFLEIESTVKPTRLMESLVVVSRSAFHKIGGFDETVNYAEGKSFIRQAVKLGLSYKIIKDPTYTFSFRRLRKFGVMKIAGAIARTELSDLTGAKTDQQALSSLYPMLGGTLFTKTRTRRNKFTKNVRKILKLLEPS